MIALNRSLRRDSTDDGNVAIFTIGIAALTLAVVLAIATAAAVHLERKRLWNFSDSIALEVSESAAVEKRFAKDLDDKFVRVRSRQRLTSPAHEREVFDHLELGPNTGIANESQIHIELRAVVRPPTLPWFLTPWSDGIEISAESTTNLAP